VVCFAIIVSVWCWIEVALYPFF